MSKSISRQNLLSWLQRLLEERAVVAPASSDGLVLFQRVSSVDQVLLDFDQTVLSAKEFVFPSSEVLFRAVERDGQTELLPTAVEQEVVLFGIHPCDARGIALIDGPLLQEPADELYREHRAKTTLVGLACSEARPECFCTSMGTAPDDASNMDIMLTRVGDSYIIEAVTEKGQALLPSEFIVESDLAPLPPPECSPLPAEDIAAALRESFDAPYWSRLADRCIHCSVCAHVCPTCYCFDIRDYRNKDSVERVRSWESCQSPWFTRLAGGHDPRANKGDKMRQRFAHKLLYFPEEFGDIACVGCGRCVRFCPVNIDIREIIADIQKLGAKSGS